MHATTVLLIIIGALLFAGQALSQSDCDPYGSCPSYAPPIPLSATVINANKVMQKAYAAAEAYVLQAFNSTPAWLIPPGFVMVAVYDQEIIWNLTLGVQDPFDPNTTAITLDSGDRIASISKVFTAMMMYDMRDRGLISLDDPVDMYLPLFQPMQPYNTTRRITLRQLASHSSGLSRETPCPLQDGPEVYTCNITELLELVNQQYLIFPQYDTPHYSNLGISILGQALAAAANTTYESYVEQNILAPLGMTSSSFNYSVVKPFLATGSNPYPNGTAQPVTVTGQGIANPAGGLFSTANDMAKFMQFMFRTNDPSSGSQPLDGSTTREAITPILLTPDGYAGFGTPFEFNYTREQRMWIRSKAGMLDGYLSDLALAHDSKLGVFAFGTNAANLDVYSSCFAFPVLTNFLVPAMQEVLQSYIPSINTTAPANSSVYEGVYVADDGVYGQSYVKVYTEDGALLVAYVSSASGTSVSGSVLLLPFIIDSTGQQAPNVFRQKSYNTLACRWQDDGQDNELAYFHCSSSGKQCESVFSMGQLFTVT